MKKNIALVLSGGAARGLAHIGVIEELEAQGYDIRSVAGNSMGAFVGAMYAMGKLKEFKEWALTFDKTDLLKLVDLSFGSAGLIKGDKLFKKMKSFLPDRNIEELDIPYVAVAADIKNMKEVILDKGDLFEAVRASIAIPTIFTPVKKEGMLLVDGGVVNPVPINRVKRFPGDILVASFVNAHIPYKRPAVSKKEEQIKRAEHDKRILEIKNKLNKKIFKHGKEKINFFNLLYKSTALMTMTLSVMTIEKYQPDLLVSVSHDAAGNFEFYKVRELIEAGREAAKKSIESFV